mmetsp:Transcript_61896/g.110004  ORF Transcript_61896/g.110004 Transcript_61896/m.110004 type:complete len:834 (-) Transcript_61896:509-3010(-)
MSGLRDVILLSLLCLGSFVPASGAETCGPMMLQERRLLKLARDVADGFQSVDGGSNRACRATNERDNSASYYTVSKASSLAECKAMCTTTTSTAPTTTTSTATEVPRCPITGPGQNLGSISTSQINECSGLAASRKNPGLYWSNNDSGDRQRLYGFDEAGQHKARLWVNGASANDWEDIAIGPGPQTEESYLYIGDFGDNYKQRGTIQIYRAVEPEVPAGQDRNSDIYVEAVRFDVTYPDGAHDCEAMFVDQGAMARSQGTSGRVYILTKSNSNGYLYWVDLPSQSASLTFTKAGQVPVPGLITGADMNPSGSVVVMRTYGEMFMWRRSSSLSVEQSLVGQGGCSVSEKGERQGEAVAFGHLGDHYITVSEGTYPTVWYFSIAPVIASLENLYPTMVRSLQAASNMCYGIEYHEASGRCELWNQNVAIQASAGVDGFTCMRYGDTTTLTTRAGTFELVDGSDRACRGQDAKDNSGAYYSVFQLDESGCKSACMQRADCQGIEFKGSRCEIWTRPEGIGATKSLSGYTCLRFVPSVPSFCGALIDVEKTCSSNGCKVLADNMQGKTCRQYCSAQGLQCLNGWEEVDETCSAQEEIGCDRSYQTSYGFTSDLLCECFPPSSPPSPPSLGSPCLCAFDIDRTLTGRQGDTERCNRNVLISGMADYGYDGGDVTLSALSAEGIKNTFCNSCYLGIVSAGSGSGVGSPWNNYILGTIMRNELQDQLTARVPSTKTWSFGEDVQSPYVLNQGNKVKQDALAGIRLWYQRQGVSITASNVYFFGDRTENILPFANYGFNSREISCGSRNNDPRWYGGSGIIGYCGAEPEEILETSGNVLC